MITKPQARRRVRGKDRGSCQIAFTLLEVMIACGLFFMAVFAILALVANTLRNAHSLQEHDADAGMLAAQLSATTNKLYEGNESGDFGDYYPGYKWTREDNEVLSNGLHQVDFTVMHRVGNKYAETHLSILLFMPDSPAGSALWSGSGGFR